MENFEEAAVSFMIGHGITYQIANNLSLFSNIRFDISGKDVEKINLKLQGYDLGSTKHIGIGFNLGIKFNIPLVTPPVIVKPAQKGKKIPEDKLRQSTPRYRKN